MGQIAVIGAADATPEEYDAGQEVGRRVAKNHETLVCGGLYGVMQAACKGAKENNGLTIGIVPDTGNGTLSEIAIALKMKQPVFGLKSWDIRGVVQCTTPEEAVFMAVRAARQSPSYRIPRAGQGSP
jgi:predicted Rossmann-fold nucleotide-binding protein